MDPGLSGPRKMALMLHVNLGRALAQHLKRVLMDSDGGNLGFFGCADAVPQRCEVCGSFDDAPHLPIAATSSATSLNEGPQVALLFLGDAPSTPIQYRRAPTTCWMHGAPLQLADSDIWQAEVVSGMWGRRMGK